MNESQAIRRANTWKAVSILLGGLTLGLVVALVLAIYIMQAPSGDLQGLLWFLLSSSVPSLLVGYLVFSVGRRRLHSIRAKVLLAYSLGIVIALINIFVTSQLMFVSQHDFLLLGLLLIFAGILSASFGYLLAARMTRSLGQLQDAAQEIAAGNLLTRVRLVEKDELFEVAEAFNRMADELEQAFSRQKAMEQARRDLIAAVSHDLRTPLASIRAMVEAMDDGLVDDPATVRRYYRTIHAQIDNLSGLINDLFELSRLDVEQVQLRLEPVNLNDLVSDVLEAMQVQARQKEILLEGHFAGDLPPVTADIARIQRVLYNLVQNALQYTPAGGRVSLTVRPAETGVQVEVTDSGEGIPPEDLPHVFDRFFRGDKSRSRATGGAGLGLAIAKRIVEAHGGHIWVESRPGQGTRFGFYLPAVPA